MQEIPTLGIKPRLGSPHQWRCELRTQIIHVFDNFSQGIFVSSEGSEYALDIKTPPEVFQVCFRGTRIPSE